ncbi:TIGR02206 family membrane protein [Nesterenkonia alba]|uniref:YwaF family protein n=1 Tax=Nesterenkonia alba TaxID=515814 RepID=UPI0003B6A112|nr:TIGR02206 family membrane protein [Nesterenkonia alba]
MGALIAAAGRPEMFSGLHWGLLGLAGALGVLVVFGMRRIRTTPAQNWVLPTAGWVLLVISVMYTVWLLLPGQWDLEQSLPLHYSDALRYITAYALIRRAQWAVAVTYFWGLTLNSQALVTPHPTMLDFSVNAGFYWVTHIAVLLAPLALLTTGWRPQWRDFAVAYGLAAAWAGLVMPANAVLGTNYAFLNRPPDGASLIDFLGPWPVYVFWLAVLVAVVWALMTWPWRGAHLTSSARGS